MGDLSWGSRSITRRLFGKVVTHKQLLSLNLLSPQPIRSCYHTQVPALTREEAMSLQSPSTSPQNSISIRQAEMRQLLFEIIPSHRLKGIINKLATMAEAGHIPAMKLLLSYIIGKPAPAPDPDPPEMNAHERQVIDTQPATTADTRRQATVTKREQKPNSASLPPRPPDRPLTLDDLCAILTDRPAHSALGSC